MTGGNLWEGAAIGAVVVALNHLGSHEDKPGRITQASDYADNSLGETIGGIAAGLQGSGVFEDNGDPPKLKFPQIGDKVMESLEGGLWDRLITGDRTYSNYWSVDNDGNISGLVPHTGTPPDLGFGKIKSVVQGIKSLPRVFRKNIFSIATNRDGGKVLTLFDKIKYVGTRYSTHGSRLNYTKSIKVKIDGKWKHIFDW